MPEYRITTSYRWTPDYDYDTVRDHTDNCDPICRCSRIENVEITGIDGEPRITVKSNTGKNGAWVNYQFSKNDVDAYGLDRIKVLCGVYDPENYEVDICGGYYGEEIDDFEFTNDDQLKEHIFKFIQKKTNYDKIIYLLELEYSFIAESLKNTHRADVVKLRLKDVSTRLLEDGFVRKEDTQYFTTIDTSIPVGVIKDGKLVDGNNRFLHLMAEHGLTSTKKFKFVKLS